MFRKSYKNFLKKIPFFWKILIFFYEKIILRLNRIKDVIFMMFLLNVWPEQVYRFSTRKLLPPPKKKLSMKNQPDAPYALFESKTSKIEKMKEINLISLGSSFDLNFLKDVKIPTFLNHFWDTLKIDKNNNIIYAPNPEKHLFYPKYSSAQTIQLKEYYNKNIIYVHNRKPELDHILNNGQELICLQVYGSSPNGSIYPFSGEVDDKYEKFISKKKIKRISIIEKFYKNLEMPPYQNWAPTSSFLPTLYGLSFVAEKINVYGWDYYLENSPNSMSQSQILFNMYKAKHDLLRSKNHFETALFNFYYGYKLSKMSNIRIYSNMGKLEKHKNLINKIERVLYQS